MDGVIGVARDTGKHVAQVSQRIDTSAAAGFHNGVEDGRFFTGFRCPDEEEVLFSDGCWPDRIFDEVVIDLHAPGGEVNLQRGPDRRRIFSARPSLSKIAREADARMASRSMGPALPLRREDSTR